MAVAVALETLATAWYCEALMPCSKTALAAIEQAVEHLDLFGGQRLGVVQPPEACFSQYPIDAVQCLHQAVVQVVRNQRSQPVMSSEPFWVVSRLR